MCAPDGWFCYVARKENGVKKSKPKEMPHLFEERIEGTIERAKKAVARAQKRVQESKVLADRARQTVEECKHRRKP